MDLSNLRRNYTLKTLDEKDVLKDPIEMLQQWLNEAIEANALEPNAMTLSTVSDEGKPSSRIVLLKELTNEGLIFFSNYNSKKGLQMNINNNVAINFIWHELERQVRVEGTVERISEEESDAYYNMRPIESRIGAWASPQSQVIVDRNILDREVHKYTDIFAKEAITRPQYWGGYIVKPNLIEFWQGRKSRLHDRIEYRKGEGYWIIARLAP